MSPAAVTTVAVRAVPGAHAADAAAPAAGFSDALPRGFLWVLDLAGLAAAFFAAQLAAPSMQRALLSMRPLNLGLRRSLSVPPLPSADFPPLMSVLWIFVVTVPATLVAMELLGGYRRFTSQTWPRVAAASVFAPIGGLSVSSLLLFALKLPASSRVLVFTYAVFASVALLAGRSLLRTYQQQRLQAGVYAKNVIVIGGSAAATAIGRHFVGIVPSTRFRLTGWLRVFALPVDEPDGSAPAVACLGSVDDLAALLVHRPIHEVIAVLSSAERDWLREVIDVCDYYRVRLRIVPEALLHGTLRDLELMFRGDPLRLPEVVLAPRHFESGALFIKRVIDVIASAALLVLLSPLFLLIAVAIKLTTPKLPIFYPWRVVGLKGNAFTGYKFTTMTAGDERKAELQALNEMQGPVFKIKNDPRITPLGRVLRKYSLNELPQLWSVLKGDMSLVGPRPAGRHELERYQLWHKRKLCVQPGITCLWQVSGRNRIANFDDWVRLDLEYIDRWTLALDFGILLRTIRVVFSGTGS